MKNSEIQERLSADTLSKKAGVYTARWGYYWGITKPSDPYADRVKERIPNATILEHGNHFAPFRGGAPVGKQSHFWVKFTIGE
jgi:hypothetical protein